MWGPRWLQGLMPIKLALMVGQAWSVWEVQQGKELWIGFWEGWGGGQLPIALLLEATRPCMVLGPPSLPEEAPPKPCQHWEAQKVAMCTQQPSAPGPWGLLSVFGRECCLSLLMSGRGRQRDLMLLMVVSKAGFLLGESLDPKSLFESCKRSGNRIQNWQIKYWLQLTGLVFQ